MGTNDLAKELQAAHVPGRQPLPAGPRPLPAGGAGGRQGDPRRRLQRHQGRGRVPRRVRAGPRPRLRRQDADPPQPGRPLQRHLRPHGRRRSSRPAASSPPSRRPRPTGAASSRSTAGWSRTCTSSRPAAPWPSARPSRPSRRGSPSGSRPSAASRAPAVAASYTSGRVSLKKAWSTPGCTISSASLPSPSSVAASSATASGVKNPSFSAKWPSTGASSADQSGCTARPRDDAVPGHARLDLVGPLGGQHQRQPAAHAEAGDAHPVTAGQQRHLVDGPAHVLGGLVEVHGHHQLPGLVGLGRALPAVEVGGQGHEPSAANRSHTSSMCGTSPHHSWMTTSGIPVPTAGVAR